MQFFITLDTTKPGNFEKFALLMKELGADWTAPHDTGDIEISDDNGSEFDQMIQNYIKAENPIVELLPERMIEEQKEQIEIQHEDIERLAPEFAQNVRDHVNALSAHIDSNVTIQRVTRGLCDELVVFVGPIPDDTIDVGVNHKLYPAYADLSLKVENGTYKMIFSKPEHVSNDDYFLWSNRVYSILHGL